MIIRESFLLAASDTDVLAAPSRLAAIPQAGTLTIEATSDACNAANNGKLTLQLPNGEIPFEDLHVPANGYSTASMVSHNETELIVSLGVAAGGHVLLQYTETGTVVTLLYVTLTF